MFRGYSKILLSLGTLAVSALSFADNRAGYNYPARNADSDDMQQDQPMSTRQRMDRYMQRNDQGQMQERVITPDAGPRVAHGVDVILTADFIYWKMREDGLGIGTTGIDNTTELASGKGSVINPKFNFEPGFKVGLGLNLNHDGWDIYSEYTWLRTNPKANRISSNAIAMTQTVKGSDGTATFASAKWGASFNVVDLELGRNFYVSKYLMTRPHFGLKGAWRHDNLSNRYTGPNDGGLDHFYRIRNNFYHWGLGVRTGLDTGWYFFRNFCIFGDFALTALWSKYDELRKDFEATVTDPSAVQVARNLNYSFYTIKPVLELALGIRYDVWWSDDDYHFAIQAGWEEQIWINENQRFNKFTGTISQGDLNLQGLTLKAQFDF